MLNSDLKLDHSKMLFRLIHYLKPIVISINFGLVHANNSISLIKISKTKNKFDEGLAEQQQLAGRRLKVYDA